MANQYFRFKQFIIHQDKCAMKVTTDACLFGSSLPPAPTKEGGAYNVLDIGTGTGLLALMYAQKNPDARIDALEIDKDAAGQAKENIDRSPWAARINIFHSDVKNFVFEKKYDLIISNPPFYENELKTADDKKNIARHGDSLGLDDLLRIISENLAANGRFALLLPYKRFEAIKELLFRHRLNPAEMVFVKQTPKHEYFRVMIFGNMERQSITATSIKEIMIWDDAQQYTAEFSRLLKDYYLYF